MERDPVTQLDEVLCSYDADTGTLPIEADVDDFVAKMRSEGLADLVGPIAQALSRVAVSLTEAAER